MAVAYLSGPQALLAIRSATGSPVAANAIYAVDAVWTYDVKVLEVLNVTKRSLGPSKHAIGMRRAGLSFKVPIRVTGVPSTSVAEVEKVLIEACGFSETLGVAVYGTSTLWRIGDGLAVTDPNAYPCDIWFNVDGVLRKLADAVGSVRFVLPAGELPWMEFDFKGTLESAGAATAIPADIEDSFPTNAHQPCAGATYDIGSYDTTATPVRRTVIDMAAEIEYHASHTDVTNGGTGPAYIVDWKPTIEIQLEEPAIGTKDFYADVLVNNPTALTGAGDVEIYVGAGDDLVTIFRASALYKGIKPENNSGVSDIVLTGSLIASTGNIDDQLKIYKT